MMSISGDGKEVVLTNGLGAATLPRMGRPPLHVKETKVRLTADQRRRIEALVGANRMAAFIRQAVENELARQERQASRQP